MDGSPNTSGYSRLCESRLGESTEFRDQLVQLRPSQSDTRILRGARGGFFSGELVFKAVGPSVLGFLVGGVEAWWSAVSLRGGDLVFLHEYVSWMKFHKNGD